MLGVPSRAMRKSSTASWLVMSRAALMRAGAIMSLTLATALWTPAQPVSAHSSHITVLLAAVRHGVGEHGRTLSSVLGLVAVPQLDSLVDTGRSTTGYGSPEETCAINVARVSLPYNPQDPDCRRLVPFSVTTSTGGGTSCQQHTPGYTEDDARLTLDSGVTTRVPDLEPEQRVSVSR